MNKGEMRLYKKSLPFNTFNIKKFGYMGKK